MGMLSESIKEVLEILLPKISEETKSGLRETRTMRTGNLLSSIKPTPIEKSIGGIQMLGYGRFLDEGTRYIKPKPFIKPSFEVVLNKEREWMEDYLGEGITRELTDNITKSTNFKVK